MCFLLPFPLLGPEKGNCSEHVAILDDAIPLKIKTKKKIPAKRHTFVLRSTAASTACSLPSTGSQSRGVCPVLGSGGHILVFLEVSSDVFPQYHTL